MAVIETILEYSVAAITDGVIRGVKIAGLRSKNGRNYPYDVLEKAAHLYEDAPVYMLHGTPPDKMHNRRNHHDHFGSLKNIQMRDTGIFGDLHVKQSHPMAEFILESDGSKFGLSHNVRVDSTSDRKTVMEIISVNSVDLVDNPATTNTLFEEEDAMTLEEYQKASEAQTARIDAMNGKLELVLESLKKPEDKELADRVAALEGKQKTGKKDRVAVLEQVTGDPNDPEAPAPIGNTHEAFLAEIRGFSITDERVRA